VATTSCRHQFFPYAVSLVFLCLQSYMHYAYNLTCIILTILHALCLQSYMHYTYNLTCIMLTILHALCLQSYMHGFFPLIIKKLNTKTFWKNKNKEKISTYFDFLWVLWISWEVPCVKYLWKKCQSYLSTTLNQLWLHVVSWSKNALVHWVLQASMKN